MDKVLREHPNSGKAHYIEAELLAKQGKFAEVRTELANAERLAPGLPFAKPEAVQHLRALAARASAAPPAPAPVAQAAPSSGMPWGMILCVAALAAPAFAYFRNKAANQASAQRYGGRQRRWRRGAARRVELSVSCAAARAKKAC